MALFASPTPTKRYGRLPQDTSKPRVHLRASGAALSPPVAVDWYSQVPAASWGMLANGPDNSIAPGYEGCGDCTVASAAHMVDQVAWYALNAPAPVTSKQTLAAYEAITGYNPTTGANDTGCELRQVLQWWVKNGLAGYKPAAYAQIDIANLDLVKTSISYFGAVYAALEVPAAFETQFDAGQPWNVPTGRSGRQIVGGHAIPLIGYDATYIYVLTWGAVQKVTYAAFAKYFDESWVVILPQLMEAAGKTPSGLDTATANADFQSLTGSTSAPFPTVTPPVPPVPPGPDIDTDDAKLAAALQMWLTAKGFTASNTPPHVHGH
jgi:hypothetical protein